MSHLNQFDHFFHLHLKEKKTVQINRLMCASRTIGVADINVTLFLLKCFIREDLKTSRLVSPNIQFPSKIDEL